MAERSMLTEYVKWVDCQYWHITNEHLSVPLHCHGQYEFILALTDNIAHRINGQMQMLSEGTLIFIRPDDEHEFISIPEKTHAGSRMNLTVPHGRWRRGNRQQLEAWDLPFLCLSLQQNFLLLYGYSGRIVQYFSFREHIASSVGTEELAHLEMVCTIVHQLTRGLSAEEIAAAGLDKYYVDHTLALWPQAAGGIPFNACEFQSKGDVITDLVEDLAADATTAKEQPPFYKARKPVI